MNISPHLTAFMLILHAATALGQSDTLPVYRSLREALVEPDKVLSLDLSDQGFEDFPMDVLLLPNLQELRLRNDGLSVLPPEIGALKKLRLLDLSGNPINVLPDRFGELDALEELYLNEDRSLELEKDLEIFARLPRLRILHLEGDGLSTLPNNMVRLRSLEELYLQSNAITTFPEVIRGMEHLKLLDLRSNPINPLIPLDLQNRGVLVKF